MPMDYNELFGGGAMAAHYAMQDRDLEQQKMQEAIKSQQLANMFNEQNNPLQLEQQRLSNEGLGYTNRQSKLKVQTAEELAPLQLDDEKRKFVLNAKKSDLDLMQLEAQRMAYSPDKATSEEGQRLLMLHRDFIKIREQGEQKVELADKKVKGQIEVEQIKQPNRIALKQTIPGKAAGSGSSGKPSAITESKVLAPILQEALRLQQAGDTEGANKALTLYQTAKQAQASGRPDSNVGKPTLAPDGSIGTVPPKAPVQFSNTAPAAKTPQHSLAQVMQMYPGVPAEKVREAYKKKFGVDLK